MYSQSAHKMKTMRRRSVQSVSSSNSSGSRSNELHLPLVQHGTLENGDGVASASSRKTTEKFIAPHPHSPKSTRLEAVLGEKLPRIRAMNGSEHIEEGNGDKMKEPAFKSNVVDSTVSEILKNAMVSTVFPDRQRGTMRLPTMSEDADIEMGQNGLWL